MRHRRVDNVLTYLVNHLTGLLPPTRCYRLKAMAYRMCGFDIHRSARLVSSVKIWGPIDLYVGRDTFLGHECFIVGGECKITIGDNVDIAPRVCIAAGTHEVDPIGEHSAGQGLSKDVVIEDGAWVGANSTVLGGVRIGRKAVVAAGSIVSRDIPPYVIAAGAPCRPVKTWNGQTRSWERCAASGSP